MLSCLLSLFHSEFYEVFLCPWNHLFLNECICLSICHFFPGVNTILDNLSSDLTSKVQGSSAHTLLTGSHYLQLLSLEFSVTLLVRYTKLFWKCISFDFLTLTDQHESVVEQEVFLKKHLNFSRKGETSISILPRKSSFWRFCQSSTLHGKVKWKSLLTFATKFLFELLTCMHWESMWSFQDESC